MERGRLRKLTGQERSLPGASEGTRPAYTVILVGDPGLALVLQDPGRYAAGVVLSLCVGGGGSVTAAPGGSRR